MKLKMIDYRLFCNYVSICGMSVECWSTLQWLWEVAQYCRNWNMLAYMPIQSIPNMLNVWYVCILEELSCFRPPGIVYRIRAVHNRAAKWGLLINDTTMGPSAICPVRWKLQCIHEENTSQRCQKSTMWTFAPSCWSQWWTTHGSGVVPWALPLWVWIDVLAILWNTFGDSLR